MPTPIFVTLLAATSLVFSFDPGGPEIHTPQINQLGLEMGANSVNDQQVLEETAINLADDFILPLTPGGENPRLMTKDDFLDYYKNISDLDLAEEFLQTYFIEHNGVLEHIPTEPPLWFNRELPYEFVKVSDTEMALSQSSSSELYGHATMTIFFSQRNENGWIIHDVQYEWEREELNEL